MHTPTHASALSLKSLPLQPPLSELTTPAQPDVEDLGLSVYHVSHKERASAESPFVETILQKRAYYRWDYLTIRQLHRKESVATHCAKRALLHMFPPA